MRKIIRICEKCACPTTVTRKESKAWDALVGTPFVCDPCMKELITACTVLAEIKKAEADTRCFQKLQIDPAQFAPAQARARRVRA